VIPVTAIADAGCYFSRQENDAMASSGTYKGWWDLSLIDERNERPLRAAFVAVIVVWVTALLFALV
jgi:hypothetical protein